MKRNKKKESIVYVYLFDLAGGGSTRVRCLHTTGAHDRLRKGADKPENEWVSFFLLLIFRYTHRQRIYIEEFFQMSRGSQYLLPFPAEEK